MLKNRSAKKQPNKTFVRIKPCKPIIITQLNDASLSGNNLYNELMCYVQLLSLFYK